MRQDLILIGAYSAVLCCTGCEILPFERKAAAARFQHLDTEIITACRVAVTFHSKLREEDTETNQKVEQFDHPQRAVGSIEGQGHSAAPPSPSDNGIPSANFHSWHSIPDKGAAPAGDDRSLSMDSSLPLSGSTSDSTMTRCYDHSSPPPVAAPSILSGSSLRSDSLFVPLQRVDMTGPMPSSANTMVISSSATLRGVPWTRTDHVDVHDPIVASISSISSTHTPSDKHPAARTTSESPQTASRPERLEAILASPPPQPPPSKGKEHLPKSPISLLRKSHESPLNKSSLSGRSAWCGSVSLRTAPTRSTSPSPSPSKQVSALSDKVERLSERIVQVENEKTAVQAEFQRQQALQQQALQQLHMDKSKTEAVNEKLKNIIYDLQITIEDNSSDLSLLRVGEEKAKEEIDRLLEKCGKDRAAMTVIVEENTELKTRISALQKSKKSMKGILKKEISSVNVTAETYSNLKAILNRKLHLEEESMLLSADRDAGTDRDKDAGTDRDRERVTAEYASDGYGGGDVQLKIAVSIPDCGPGSSPDATLRRQSNLALREYKRALGVLCCLSATFLFSCVLTALLSAAHPSQQVIYVTSVSISSLHPIDPLKSP